MNQPDIKTKAVNTTKEFIQQLNKYHFRTSEITEKQYHFEFDVLREKEKVKVLVYFGKKGLKTVIQGNQKSDLYKEVEEIVTGKLYLDFDEQQFDEPEKYIGSDETGKGDVFGPIVTCAVYVDKNTNKKLRSVGVRDSKDIGQQQIIKIAKEVEKIVGDNYEIISINPSKYNQLYENFGNINEILNWSHTKAIENLLSKTSAEVIITDKFRKKDLDFSKEFNFSNYTIIQEPKAEKYTAVAAASILAKKKQLDWFERQKKNGLPLIRGASQEVKELAETLLKVNGKKQLSEFAKMHFKTIKSLI
ncbi:MAG: ribonuclease HIII [Melioribacteraceae bacterium]|nr:ribonuclease HIII [Melioribacteraceae bacterium]